MGKVISYRPEHKVLPNELLLMYRQRSGLTQNQLAAQLGLKSDRMVQKWESGYTLPTAARLQSLIQLYLQAGVFVASKETEEAHQLWTAVKNMFDQNSATYETYPIFDSGWFEQCLLDLRETAVPTTSAPATQSATTQAAPPSLIPLNRPQTYRSVTTLPIPPNRLVGREDEVKIILALLRQVKAGQQPIRLLTLTGPGGSGKTRLAIQVATELQTQYSQVWFVPLASVLDPRLVTFTIAQALGLKEQAGFDNAELLQNFLASKHALLVLDNFEHLLGASSLLHNLLQSCPHLTILVTSRIALRLGGEHEFPVAPLKLPPLAPKTADALQLNRQYSAITLFVERAQAVKPSFDLEAANIKAVTEICRRLDGLPLALELAAAWIKLLSPQTLLTRLTDNQTHVRLQMLNTGGVGLPERQKTIWASVDWSYSLLSQAEQTLLRRLAIFNGGWELAAAEEICAGEGLEQAAILDLLYQLVNHSLVVVEDEVKAEGIYSEPRFRLLEIIRQYGWERLQEAGEVESLIERYLGYYLKIVEEAEGWVYSPQEKQAYFRFSIEINNIRAGLKWGLEINTFATRESALRIAAALRWYWLHHSLAEGRNWLEQCLDNLPDQLLNKPNLWRAKALVRAAHLAFNQGDNRLFRQRCEESLKIFSLIDYQPGRAESLRFLSSALFKVAEPESALAAAKESLKVAQNIENKALQASATHQLGNIHYKQENFIQARLYQEESLRLWQECGITAAQAVILLSLGLVEMAQKDYPGARNIFKKSLEMSLAVNDLWNVVGVLAFGLTRLLLLEGKVVQSALLLGLIETLREQIGWKEVYSEAKDYLETMDTVRRQLGEEKFNLLYQQGRQMSLEEVLANWQ